MNFRVKIEPEAKSEIIEAFNWYEEQSFDLGGEFLRAVKQAEAASRATPTCIKFTIETCDAPICGGFPMRRTISSRGMKSRWFHVFISVATPSTGFSRHEGSKHVD